MSLRLLLLFTSILLCLVCIGQEHTFPLTHNQALKAARHQQPSSSSLRISLPVTLPFIDDFSREGVFPQISLWSDSNVFINSNYPDDPLTIGVATFDGIDKFGNPYDILAIQSTIADYLTSQPIDLSSFANDTSIWFSFFYQPQGIGDQPESRDSLVLEFLDFAGNWRHMWSVPGRPDTVFQRVSIRVSGSDFLYNGFRFRFYNYATVNGNRDHWHIDYVTLKANSSVNDPIRDNGFIRPQYSLLRDFEAMPYEHYKALSSQSAEMKPFFSDSIRNIDYGPTSFTYVSTISDAVGNVLVSSTPSTLSGNSNTVVPFTTSFTPFSFPVTPAGKADFFMKNYVSITGTQSNLYNDTVRYRQKFDNYYAYDDGTAEIGYGVTGNSGVKMAYQFDIKKQDTLRGIDIYFNPGGTNVNTSLIQICYWDQLSVNPSSDNLVYRQINQRPKNVDSINGFARYLFDTLLIVQPGPIWIGFIQNNPALMIGLGLDKNTDRHEHMFYHVDGRWDTSAVIGSWMMRPLLGDSIYEGVIGIDEPQAPLPFAIYPQPANDKVVVRAAEQVPLLFEILDTRGVLVRSGKTGGVIETSFLPQGLYLLRVSTEDLRQSGSKALLIQR